MSCAVGKLSVSSKSGQSVTLFIPILQPKEVLNGQTWDSQPLRDHFTLKQFRRLYFRGTFGFLRSSHTENGTKVEGVIWQAETLKNTLRLHSIVSLQDITAQGIWFETEQKETRRRAPGAQSRSVETVTSSPDLSQPGSAALVQWFSNFSYIRITCRACKHRLLGPSLGLADRGGLGRPS